MSGYSKQQYRNLLDGNRAVFLATQGTRPGPAGELIGMTVLNGRGDVLIDTWIEPRQRIPPDNPFARSVFDFNQYSAQRWPEIHEKFLEATADGLIFSQNPENDAALIYQTAKAYCLVPAFFRYELSAKMIPLPGSSRVAFCEHGVSPREVAERMVVLVNNFSG